MTSFDFYLGTETLTQAVREQQAAMMSEAEALGEAEPADAISRLLVGLLFAGTGYLALQNATAVSGPMVVGYALAGRAAVSVVGLIALRIGGPRVLSGLRTVRMVRQGAYDDGDDDDLEDSRDSDPVKERRERSVDADAGELF